MIFTRLFFALDDRLEAYPTAAGRLGWHWGNFERRLCLKATLVAHLLLDQVFAEMKTVIANYKAPIIVLLSLLGLLANSFAWQYWLNPGGVIIGLPLLLPLLYFSLAPVFSLFREQCKIGKTIRMICFVLLAWIISVAVSRFIPNGVAVRLSQYSEQDFQEISGLIDAADEKHRNESDALVDGDDYQSFIKELKESHDIFNLSTFPVRVSKEDDCKTIGWYGGLVGGYDVAIFEKGNLPEWLRKYRVVYLYDTVVFYDIEDYADDE